jgi:hypothetical protein
MYTIKSLFYKNCWRIQSYTCIFPNDWSTITKYKFLFIDVEYFYREVSTEAQLIFDFSKGYKKKQHKNVYNLESVEQLRKLENIIV